MPPEPEWRLNELKELIIAAALLLEGTRLYASHDPRQAVGSPIREIDGAQRLFDTTLKHWMHASIDKALWERHQDSDES